jgi:hypothetical protein
MRKALVEQYVTELLGSFGGYTRRPADDSELEHLWLARDYTAMLGFVQRVLAVDCNLSLGLVNSGGPDAPAWVILPDKLPLYGSSSFKNYRATVYVRRTYLAKAPFEVVVKTLAHELSHVLLNSLPHSLREKEEAVDLTAMILGFRDFYVTGSHMVVDDMHYQTSYLSREEVSHAAEFMTFGQPR